MRPGKPRAGRSPASAPAGRLICATSPGVEAGSHDDIYVTGLETGSISVTNPRRGVGFRLAWDVDVFGWVVVWQAYGGALELPLAGSYALGIEPWTSRHCLEQAVDAGEAVELAGGGRLETTLRAGFTRVNAAPGTVSAP